MEEPRRRRFDADEFIAWGLEQPEGRYELSHGEVVRLGPDRVDHALVKGDVWVALRAAVRARGLEGEALPNGMAVRVGADSVYDPDALLRCGARLPGDAAEIADPVVVVEVVSPVVRGIDAGAKLYGYFGLPSLRHYVMVLTGDRAVVHHRRGAAGVIETRFLREGTLELDPPGIEIEVADMLASL
ncbi:Uma2 family endonuclease [Amaricoccus sp.]|uniref:Uma2 family endonuclease n=1 Tax=Amaricoccus sp. TaxID=1872485 RepID=UPI001B486990|nr:Uma2 family endonuclease [Amaricoccus sp.]MBP7002029.1 Uma2 family endonuclease [Amaricoccus sp.]